MAEAEDVSPTPAGGDWTNPATPVSAPVHAGGRTLRLAWWTMAAIVAADQLSKWLVVQFIPVFSSVIVVPGLVDLVNVRNTGIAFGFLNDLEHAWQSGLTTTLALVALAGILYYALHLGPDERRARFGLSLILAGAVGNLIDRARQGFVVDFVDVYWRDWHFWAFNVADSAISIGAVLILVDLVLPHHHVSHPV